MRNMFQFGRSMSSPSPTLAEKRNEWLEALNGKDRHSVFNQLRRMTWDIASFRVINKARSLAPPAQNGGMTLSPLLHNLLNRSFFTSQLAAIRRLIDRYESKPKRSVFSLTALLENMQSHHALFTRESMFDGEGREYDYKQRKRWNRKFVAKKQRSGEMAYMMPREVCYHRNERRHEIIDCLTGTEFSARTPEDSVAETVFTCLKEKITLTSENVRTYVDQFIAHPATPESRELRNSDSLRLTLGHVYEGHRTLCQVASFLGNVILGSSVGAFLPEPVYDQFAFIAAPLVREPDIPELKEERKGFDKDCREWSQWSIDGYMAEFGEPGA